MTDMLRCTDAIDPSFVYADAHVPLIMGVIKAYDSYRVVRAVVPEELAPKAWPDLLDHAQIRGGDVQRVATLDALHTVTAPNLGVFVLGHVA